MGLIEMGMVIHNHSDESLELKTSDHSDVMVFFGGSKKRFIPCVQSNAGEILARIFYSTDRSWFFKKWL